MPTMHLRALSLSLLAFTFALHGCAQEEPSEPVPYSSTEGNYRISFPPGHGSVRDTVIAVAPPNDSVAPKMVIAYGPLGAATVSWIDYPHGAIQAVGDRRLLDTLRTMVAEKMGGPVVSQQAITRSGFPGESVVVAGKQTYARTDFVVVNDRLYQIALSAASDSSLKVPAADAYFASFALITPPAVATDSSAVDSTASDTTGQIDSAR